MVKVLCFLSGALHVRFVALSPKKVYFALLGNISSEITEYGVTILY